MFAPCATIVLAGLLAAQPLPRELPENDGWVTDLAGLLSDSQEHALEARMESYRAGTGHEIALLTLPELDGQSIERLALEVARAWKLGGVEQKDGALIVVAIAERQVRIEVGHGLEGNLTDSISGRIIRDVITPSFQRGEYAEGLELGVEAVHAAIGGDYGPIRRTREGQANSPGAAAVGLVAMVVFLSILRSPGGRHGGRGPGGGGVWVGPWIGGGGGGFGGGSSGGGFGGFGGFGGGGSFGGGGATGGW